jgi:DNA-binding response OmpR family regulator
LVLVTAVPKMLKRHCVEMPKRSVKETVLWVDDEETVRSAIAVVLRRAGYRVLVASTYQDALATFESNRDAITLLIADISLPGGNGCELALAMREQNRDLRVLFVSGHVGAEFCRFYGLEATDLCFLAKPFQNNELLLRVQQVLNAPIPFPNFCVRTDAVFSANKAG